MGIKMRSSQWCISGIIFMVLLTGTLGAAPEGPRITSAAIGKKELTGAGEVTIITDNLIGNREALIVGTADGGGPQVEKVEVSLNGGQTWNDATGKEAWQYRFVPVPNYTYFVTLRLTNADGVVSDHRAFGITRLTYLPITLSELIQRKIDELARTYMTKDRDRYMGLVSRGYQNYPRGWFQLRKAIENDFKSLNGIVLRLTVNQVFEIERIIIAECHWRLAYAGLAEPKEGYVEIHFDPADDLKILVQKKDLYFGEAVIGHNGSVQVTRVALQPRCNFTVTDLDKVGATFVTIRIRQVNVSGAVQFDRNVTLTETPPRSGIFVGSQTFSFSALDTVTAIYIDEITSDWRRNVRQSDTYTVP